MSFSRSQTTDDAGVEAERSYREGSGVHLLSKRYPTRYALSLGLGLALLGSAPPALAHAELLRAMPQPGSVISTSPSEVRLQFSEGIEGRFSGLDVAASNGKRITTGRAHIQGTALVVPITAPLPPGVYRVNWHVLSVDSHKTQGSFTFEVRP